jgi:phosphonate transport system substrate-binding protein
LLCSNLELKELTLNIVKKIAVAVALLGSVASAQALTLGVTEGITYRVSEKELAAKFEPLAEILSRALREPVTIRVIPTYNGLREALKSNSIDAAFIHPAHLVYEAVKTGSYRTVAWTQGFTEYRVSFLCKDQPIQDWRAVAARAFVTPDPDSITAVMTRAMLRENALDPTKVKVQTTRYQDAVPFFVENGFANYGATASRAVVKEWTDKGGKTCAQSRSVPIKQWIASSKMSDAAISTMREALVSMAQTDAGKRALTTVGYTGFITPVDDTEKKVMAWLGI